MRKKRLIHAWNEYQQAKAIQTPFEEVIDEYNDNDVVCYLKSILQARTALNRTKNPIMQEFYDKVCDLAQQYLKQMIY